MKSFLIKFVFRINGGINFYFVCWGKRVVREQYVVITSGLAAVASFCSWLFCSRKYGGGLRTVYYLCFWCYQRNEDMGWVQDFPVHQRAATNFMHLQSNYTPHLQHIQSEAHLQSSRISAVELFAEIVNVLRPLGIFAEVFHRGCSTGF